MRRVIQILVALCVVARLVVLVGGDHRQSQFGRIAALMPHPADAKSISTGTGFFIDLSGGLLTASHVVGSCRRIEIASSTIAPVDATIVALNPDLDIALLRTSWRPSAALELAGASASNGDLTVVGYPSGGPLLDATTSPMRLVNNRVMRHAGFSADTLLLLDGNIQHGNSGGPVLDAYGRAVGIVLKLASHDEAVKEFGIDLPTMGLGEGISALQLFLARTRYSPALPVRFDRLRSVQSPEISRSIVRVFCWE